VPESEALAALVPQVELSETEEAERRRRFPAGAGIEFADLEEHGRVEALDRLREAEPVSWVPALGGWLVTAYPLARSVLARTEDFSVWAEPNLVRASLGVMMLTSDSPEHERQRQPFDEPFRRRAVHERFEARVATRVERLLAELAPSGACELASEFATPFAIDVAGDILGLSLDDVRKIQGFYEAFAGAMTYDGDPEPQRRADAARTAFNEVLHGELARMRGEPDGSITSAVVNDPGTELSDEEITAQLRVILFGAIETVESMVVNAV
jgi:cytochrome P450